MSEPLASAEVTYDRDDFRAFARQIRQERMQLYRRIAVALVILMGVTLALYAILRQPLPLWQAGLGLVAAALLWTLASPVVQGKLIEQRARRSELLVPQSFEIADEGFEARSSRGHSLVKWSAIPAFEIEDGRLFVFVSHESAYIIPRRAFADDAKFDAFVTAARERWTLHHRL
jgi:hypothetical protein